MGKKQKVSDYVKNLDPKKMTGNWAPAGTWRRIHGDTKSSTGGKWHMETMTTSTQPAKYKVKLVEDAAAIWTKEYDSEPTFETIVEDVQAAKG
ncbi:unnamed protein product [Fusarium equiseti]|uniref:Uncharacterized protein n=1 Tax=Fusarium equiseti TaxID=61235 RepID=A0A8J2NFC0_FUSEQ|nr:unnamed protein product [Fusarium equiseti]